MSAAQPPRVWVLLGYGFGGNAQLLRLARALDWPFETKHIRYNPLNYLPNPLLGASAVTVKQRRSDPLQPPWPDLVIAASRRAAPLALWIKQQSGGRTQLVHLLHAQAPLDRFDLVVTTPQYGLPQRPNVLHNLLPLNTPDPERLRQAGEYWRPRLTGLPRPWIAVLTGGNCSSYRFSAAVADRLAEHAGRKARETGGSLLISTSPRTPQDAARTLARSIQVPARIHIWYDSRQTNDENPYLGFLALADRFIVTADSASMLAEACASGRPVEVFDWPTRGSRLAALGAPLKRLPVVQRLRMQCIERGLVKPRRDFHAFHRALAAHGLLGDSDGASRPQPPDDLAATVGRIRDLMGEEPLQADGEDRQKFSMSGA